MKGKTRLKRILGAALIILFIGASYVTYEVIRLNRDMEELGRGLGDLSQGLHELGQGLAQINFSRDSAATASDTLNVTPSEVDSAGIDID